MKQSLISKYNLLQKLRLYSGIVLMFYAFTHLLNHAFGIVHLGFLEQQRLIFVDFWRHPLMSWVVPTSLLVHAALAVYKMYWKSTFKGLSRNEWLQIVLGLIVPLLLIPHVMETRISRLIFDTDDNYSIYLGTYFPEYLIEWVIAILVIWSHGVIGLKLYLKQKPWFPRWRGLFQFVSISLPIFAVMGIVSAGKEILSLKQDPAWFEKIQQQSNPTGSGWEDMQFVYANLVYLLLILIVFVGRKFRLKGADEKRSITVNYLNGESVAVSNGTSLLEASLKARIPHAHVCGGRGRCSTCRVQVIEGFDNISPPGEEELVLLRRVNVDKNVRLACKTIPHGPCTIYPLLTADTTTFFAHKAHPEKLGVDKEIAILFSDIRGFTALTEHKLPYDVVHVLNQYYQFMGQAIEANGGKVDKFIGDGIMALFGLESGLKTGCAQALAATKAMSEQLVLLNESLKNELDKPLVLGIGIHCGSAIVGEMGYRSVTNFTAIGDVVNTASRLENECKEIGCELVVSDQVVRNAEVDPSAFSPHKLKVRGRSQPLLVYSLERVLDWER